MASTQLSPIGTPGKRYSFSAKTAAGVEARPEGLFTALSVSGLPGPIHSFSAKAVTGATERGADLFTALSVLAVPGRIHSFSAKGEVAIAAAPIIEEEDGGSGPARREYDHLMRLRRDDDEILKIILEMLKRGILN